MARKIQHANTARKMDTDGYYSPKDVRDLTGASESAVRNYCRDYERWLSTEATTVPRRFTAQDVKLVAFIIDRTKRQNQNHADVTAALQAGELEQFAWDAPPSVTVRSGEAQGPQGEQSTALVPLAFLEAANELRLDALRREQEARIEAQQREQAAQARERELQDQVVELQRQVGELAGELKAVKAQRRQAPKWWRAVFGGRESE